MAQQWDLTVQLKRTGEILEVHSFAAGSFCVAQPNEEFAIIFHNQASQKVSFDLSVDGKKVGSTKHTGPNKTFTTPGWRLDDHNCRAFVFSPPPTFDASQPRAAPARRRAPPEQQRPPPHHCAGSTSRMRGGV